MYVGKICIDPQIKLYENSTIIKTQILFFPICCHVV